MLADCEGNGLSVGSERTSEVHSEVEEYKKLVDSYEDLVARTMQVIRVLTESRDNAVKSTAKRCMNIAKSNLMASHAIAEEFGLNGA